jgi:hypothetical protein
MFPAGAVAVATTVIAVARESAPGGTLTEAFPSVLVTAPPLGPTPDGPPLSPPPAQEIIRMLRNNANVNTKLVRADMFLSWPSSDTYEKQREERPVLESTVDIKSDGQLASYTFRTYRDNVERHRLIPVGLC